MSADVVKKNKKLRAASLVAAGVVVALAMGGGTFALWSASDTFDGGTITSGDLNLVASSVDGWYDVSPDRSDATTLVAGKAAVPETSEGAGDGTAAVDAVYGHPITDMNTWRMVPGDTVARVFAVDVTLEGDNLVAELSLTGGAAGDDGTFTWGDNLTYGYTLYKGETKLGSGVLADGVIATIEAPQAGQAAGQSDGLTVAMTSTTESYTLLVTAAFDAATPDREDVSAHDALGDLSLSLDQVRTPGTGIFVER